MTTSETVLAKPQSAAKIHLALPHWLRNNPILLKEMRARMRGWRSIVALTGFITLLSAIVSLIYFSFTSVGGLIGVNVLNEIGRAIFFTIYGIELLVVCMVSPALTAGAISTEKEQQTYDLLRTTLLSARALILGKLIAAVSFVLLFILAVIPLQSIAFMFGGLSMGEVILSFLILVLTALAFGSVGIFYSSFIPKTRVATAAAQITSMVFVIVLPVLVLFAAISSDNWLNLNQMSDLTQTFLIATLWLAGITSPAVTAAATEIFLAQDQSLFFITEQLSGGTNLTIPSPWLGFIILYPLITLILLTLTIRIVQRAEK